MAATVVIRSFHGTTGATTNDIDNGNARFKAADDDTVDANNPLVIPGAGTIYSYLKQFKFRITGTPPSNSINNFKFYTDGANGFGTGVGLTVGTNASYTNPVANAQTQVAALVNAFQYVSATPLSVSGSGSSANTDIGDYILLQMSVASTAGQGTTPSETLTFQYDES